MVPRNCILHPPYKKVAVPASLSIVGEIIAFASPDSTFFVTKELLDSAKKTIEIGIYDFSAAYVATILKNAIARRVKVTLMLDTDHVKERTQSSMTSRVWARTAFPLRRVPAPTRLPKFSAPPTRNLSLSTANCGRQSGNFSPHSIPLNTLDGVDNGHFHTGNRDMGVAVHSKPLAAFLHKILDSDISLELNAPEPSDAAVEALTPPPTLVEAAPTKASRSIISEQDIYAE